MAGLDRDAVAVAAGRLVIDSAAIGHRHHASRSVDGEATVSGVRQTIDHCVASRIPGRGSNADRHAVGDAFGDAVDRNIAIDGDRQRGAEEELNGDGVARDKPLVSLVGCREICRLVFTCYVDVPRVVDGDAVAVVLIVAAQIGRVDQAVVAGVLRLSFVINTSRTPLFVCW